MCPIWFFLLDGPWPCMIDGECSVLTWAARAPVSGATGVSVQRLNCGRITCHPSAPRPPAAPDADALAVIV